MPSVVTTPLICGCQASVTIAIFFIFTPAEGYRKRHAFTPVDDTEGAAFVFCQRRTAFHPVSGVAVERVAHHLDGSVMDVTTDDTVNLLFPDRTQQMLLEIAYVINGLLLAFMFEVGRNGEVLFAEYSSPGVDPAVNNQ